VSAFFIGIQKRRQALFGRRACEALVEEPGQQAGVALEKLGVHAMLGKQAQWTASGTAWRQAGGELRRGDDFLRHLRQPQAALGHQQRMKGTIYLLDQIFELSVFLANRWIVGSCNPFGGAAQVPAHWQGNWGQPCSVADGFPVDLTHFHAPPTLHMPEHRLDVVSEESCRRLADVEALRPASGIEQAFQAYAGALPLSGQAATDVSGRLHAWP